MPGAPNGCDTISPLALSIAPSGPIETLVGRRSRREAESDRPHRQGDEQERGKRQQNGRGNLDQAKPGQAASLRFSPQAYPM